MEDELRADIDPRVTLEVADGQKYVEHPVLQVDSVSVDHIYSVRA